MTDPELVEFETYALESLEVRVRGGFTTLEELVEQFREDASDELDESNPEVTSLVERLEAQATERFELQRSVERGWGDQRTTNDAIDEAFDALNDAGIVALQNAGMTLADGWSDCQERSDTLGDQGERPRGATFFHGQDLERGVRGEGLWLAFGSLDGGDAESLQVGHEVVATLKQHGVNAEWNGSIEQRIAIPPFEWRRRQF